MSSPKPNITVSYPYVCNWKIVPEDMKYDVVKLEISSFDFVNNGQNNCNGLYSNFRFLKQKELRGISRIIPFNNHAVHLPFLFLPFNSQETNLE